MSAPAVDPDRHGPPARDDEDPHAHDLCDPSASGRPPPLEGIYETVLYGPDLGALAHFYIDLLGLRQIEGGPADLLVACRLPDGGVLLLFDPAAAGATGREVPAHGSTGPSHVAFRVAPEELMAWQAWLELRGVEIEREVHWSDGLRSIYMRDPAGNSVELAGGELWD